MLHIASPARHLVQQMAQVDPDRVVAAVHHVVGWGLVVVAVLVIATAGPRLRSRVFAVLFATLLVLVVVAGCGAPAPIV